MQFLCYQDEQYVDIVLKNIPHDLWKSKDIREFKFWFLNTSLWNRSSEFAFMVVIIFVNVCYWHTFINWSGSLADQEGSGQCRDQTSGNMM